MITPGGVYWVCGMGICRISTAGDPEQLASGYCVSLVADGDQVEFLYFMGGGR